MTASSSARTFPSLLAEQVKAAGSRPLVTFYDDATGEWVELSVVTYANWVAKTAGLLQDELGVGRGDVVRVDLPTHWLAAVWLGACWSVGAAVTPDQDSADQPALVVTGPDRLEELAAGRASVVAVSLRPLGARFTDPLPAGVIDFGAVVWGQPDAFLAYDPPAPEDTAWAFGDRRESQASVLALAAEPDWPTGVRLLTDVNPSSPDGLRALVGPLLHGGGTVWVRHARPELWAERRQAERATHELRTSAAG